MDVRYGIKRNSKWLQDVCSNEKYVENARAPTMGVRHTYSEFKTVWGNAPVYFERLTMASHIKVLAEEYRWNDKKAMDFKVVCKIMGNY